MIMMMPAAAVLTALRRRGAHVLIRVKIDHHGDPPLFVDITPTKAERIVKRSGHALVACEIRPNGLIVLGT